jgi:hypothetical protein
MIGHSDTYGQNNKIIELKDYSVIAFIYILAALMFISMVIINKWW